MHVPGVAGGSGAAAMSQASPMADGKWENQHTGAMSSVASLLETTLPALQASTRTQSLSQIATATGVGQASLESAIKAGLQQAGTQLTGARLDNIAHRIATHRPALRFAQPAISSTAPGGAAGTASWAATGDAAGLDLSL